MRSKRWTVAVIGALALSPVLAACGGSDEPDDEASDPSSSEATDRTSPADDSGDDGASDGGSSGAPEEPVGGLPAACDVLSAEDIATAYGATPAAGTPGGGGYSEQQVEWQTDNCDFEAEDFFEVELALAGHDDFPTGFICLPQTDVAATVEQVKVPGADSAGWKVSDGESFEAELRVCTAHAMFDLSLDFEDGYQHEGDPKAQTIGLAEVVLERIG